MVLRAEVIDRPRGSAMSVASKLAVGKVGNLIAEDKPILHSQHDAQRHLECVVPQNIFDRAHVFISVEKYSTPVACTPVGNICALIVIVLERHVTSNQSLSPYFP